MSSGNKTAVFCEGGTYPDSRDKFTILQSVGMSKFSFNKTTGRGSRLQDLDTTVRASSETSTIEVGEKAFVTLFYSHLSRIEDSIILLLPFSRTRAFQQQDLSHNTCHRQPNRHYNIQLIVKRQFIQGTEEIRHFGSFEFTSSILFLISLILFSKKVTKLLTSSVAEEQDGRHFSGFLWRRRSMVRKRDLLSLPASTIRLE